MLRKLDAPKPKPKKSGIRDAARIPKPRKNSHRRKAVWLRYDEYCTNERKCHHDRLASRFNVLDFSRFAIDEHLDRRPSDGSRPKSRAGRKPLTDLLAGWDIHRVDAPTLPRVPVLLVDGKIESVRRENQQPLNKRRDH